VKFVRLVIILVCVLGSMPLAALAQDESLDGVWLSDGYGYLFEIQGSQFTFYEVTEISCIQVIETEIVDNTIPDLGVTLQLEGDQVVVVDRMTLYITATKQDALPAVCENGGTEATDDPELNFEVFWHVFNEHYAFFDLYGVDWQAQYDQYRPQVTPETTPDELFALMSDMISPLKDGHISLSSETDDYSPGPLPEWYTEAGDEVEQYLVDYFINSDELTRTGNDLIAYKRLSDTVGYINILTMYGYGTSAEDTRAAAGAAIDQALADLGDVETIIVDVRWNGGGEDGIALEIAGRFADQSYLAFSKQTRDGDSFTPLREYQVVPGGEKQFTGETIVLTSGVTASAAEIFIMAMGALPNVTVMGEPTSGGHSDILGRTLPNGGGVGLSNQVYYASDGQIYESIGMQPDVVVPLDFEALIAGNDLSIAAAVEYAAAN